MSHNFRTFADMHKPKIDRQLRVAVKGAATDTTSQPAYTELLRQIQVLVGRGGKRLRPLLCVLAYQAYGGKNGADIYRAAAAQELIHSYLLIHDDVIDRDYHRWGGRNILGIYFDRFSRLLIPTEALHQAEARALLAGDICATLANTVLLETSFPDNLKLQAFQLQQQAIMRVMAGELADTAFPYQKVFPTEQQILQAYADKTASYSFVLPLQVGATLAGVPTSELERLQGFARNVGIAYQLQDDILGVFGDETLTGKPNSGDIREGKRTVLVLKTIEALAADDLHIFMTLLGDDQLTDSDLQKARDLMVTSGSQEYVVKLIEDYIAEALASLAKTNMAEVSRALLEDFVQQLVGRDY